MSISRFGIAAAIAVSGVMMTPAMGDLTGMSYEVVGENLIDPVNGNCWTVRVYLDVDPGNQVNAVAGNSNVSKTISTSDSFYQDASAGPTSLSCNSDFFGFVPDMEWDSYVTIGCLYANGFPFASNAMNQIGMDWDPFEAGGTLFADNGTWFATPGEEQCNSANHNSTDGVKNGVLIAQLTVLGGPGSTITFEGLFQGREADGVTTWQSPSQIVIDAPEGPMDCNGNGVEDSIDIDSGFSQDCNNNNVPDECDISEGNSADCDFNDVPDECQGDDCDGNGTPDSCDLADGAADCDNNGVLDICDLNNGAADCNGNSVPDSCDIAGGSSDDCDGDGTPDECEIDSDGDGTIDDCEYTAYLNVETGVTYDTFDNAAAEAGNHDRIEADFEAINAETHVDFRGKALEVTVVSGNLNQPDGSTMNLGNGSRIEGGDFVDLGGSVRSNATHAEMSADITMTVASTGSMTVRENSAIEVDSPHMANDGEITVRDNGDLDLNLVGSFLNNGTLHSYGDAAIHADDFTNTASGDMTVSGHLYMTLENSGSCQLTDNTVLTGDLNNNVGGLVSAVAGQMFVLGDLNNNGTIVGDVGEGLRDSGGNLRVSGNFSAGPDSSLILPAGWQLSAGGNCDIAINDSNRLVVIDGSIRMNLGTSANSTIEAMCEDLGETLDGVVSSNFAIGSLTIGLGKSVTVVDERVNGGDDEIMYVGTLTVEAGATFDGGDTTVWAIEIINNGTILGDVDVIDPAVPCDGDYNGDEFVNIDDLLMVLGNWGNDADGGDGDGDGDADIDDLLIVLGNWGVCE